MTLLVIGILALATMLSGCVTPQQASAPQPSGSASVPPSSTPSPSQLPRPSPSAPPARQINGSLETTNGVWVLKLWGSHQEMGYAQGYLCARQIVALVQGLLGASLPEATYEKTLALMNREIQWPEDYLIELRAMLAGMQDALGGSLPLISSRHIEGGAKKLDLDMLALIFSLNDISNASSCSGFAAWGQATDHGQVMVGGNKDQLIPPGSQVMENAAIIVRKPDHGFSTISVNMLQSIGIFWGMNEKGIATTFQGSSTPWVEVTTLAYIASVLRRDVLEKVTVGPDMVAQVRSMFEGHPACLSSNGLFVQPKPTWTDAKSDQMAVVIENDFNGVTPRLPSANPSYNTPLTDAIVTTNHFLQRQVPSSFKPPQWWVDNQQNSRDRYNKIVQVLITRKISNLSDIQRVLQSASAPQSIQSVYYEPDTMKIHVAFTKKNDPPSPYVTPVSFTWDELFANIPK